MIKLSSLTENTISHQGFVYSYSNVKNHTAEYDTITIDIERFTSMNIILQMVHCHHLAVVMSMTQQAADSIGVGIAAGC
jgi:hypothetical protein